MAPNYFHFQELLFMHKHKTYTEFNKAWDAGVSIGSDLWKMPCLMVRLEDEKWEGTERPSNPVQHNSTGGLTLGKTHLASYSFYKWIIFKLHVPLVSLKCVFWRQHNTLQGKCSEHKHTPGVAITILPRKEHSMWRRCIMLVIYHAMLWIW